MTETLHPIEKVETVTSFQDVLTYREFEHGPNALGFPRYGSPESGEASVVVNAPSSMAEVVLPVLRENV